MVYRNRELERRDYIRKCSRSYGGTKHNSFAREVCAFFDRNRDDTLLLEDALLKCGDKLARSYAGREKHVAVKILSKLVLHGWLSAEYSDTTSSGWTFKATYSAGPLIKALSEYGT